MDPPDWRYLSDIYNAGRPKDSLIVAQVMRSVSLRAQVVTWRYQRSSLMAQSGEAVRTPRPLSSSTISRTSWDAHVCTWTERLWLIDYP